jgi:HK97 gp10 family phage protein
MRLSATANTNSVDIGSWIQANVTPKVRSAGEQSAILVMDTAKAIVPVDTGRLRDSIDYQVVEDAQQITWIIAPHTEYADFVEFGTSRQAPEPYMRPAWDQNEAKVFELFNRGAGI